MEQVVRLILILQIVLQCPRVHQAILVLEQTLIVQLIILMTVQQNHGHKIITLIKIVILGREEIQIIIVDGLIARRIDRIIHGRVVVEINQVVHGRIALQEVAQAVGVVVAHRPHLLQVVEAVGRDNKY